MAAQDEMRREAGAVKDEARALFSDAAEAARSAAGRQQQAAADGIGNFAGALRDAAHRGDDEAPASRMAQSLADGLDRFSRSLKTRDIGSLVRDVEDFARAQPLVFFGVAIAAGFLATRFLKSSAPDERAYGESYDRDLAGDASFAYRESGRDMTGAGDTRAGRDSVLGNREAMQSGMGTRERPSDDSALSQGGASPDSKPGAPGSGTPPGSTR